MDLNRFCPCFLKCYHTSAIPKCYRKNWRFETPIPWLSVTHMDGEGVSIQNEAEIIEETYGAKIVNYEYDAPITNEFDLFN